MDANDTFPKRKIRTITETNKDKIVQLSSPLSICMYLRVSIDVNRKE